MPTLLVSGAGIGDSQYFGTTDVANSASGARQEGWLAGAFGAASVSFLLPARALNFNFTLASSQPANSVRFDFDPNRPIFGSGWRSSAVSAPSVANSASGMRPTGWASSRFGAAVVSADLPGRQISFNFLLAFSQPGGNVGLYFDGKPLVPSAGAGLLTGFGTAALETALQLSPVGIAPPLMVRPVLYVGRGNPLNFNFVAAYTPPTMPVRLDFDPQRPVYVAGFSALSVGSATVTNSALGVRAVGFDAARFGVARASVALQARGLDFDFVDPYTHPTGANIAFAFGEARAANPSGHDSQSFGTASVGFYVPPTLHIYPTPYDASQLTEPNVHFFFSYFRPDPINSLAMGAHAVSLYYRLVYPYGFLATGYGGASIHNVIPEAIRPPSIASEGAGYHSVRNTRRAVYPEGIDSLRFGPVTLTKSIGDAQRIEVSPLPEPPEVPPPNISFYLQHITFLDYGPQTVYGTALVRFRAYYLLAEGWSSRTMGRPKVIREFPAQTLPMPGEDQLRVGDPTVEFGSNVRPIQGFTTMEVGEHRVVLMRQYVRFGPGEAQDCAGYGHPLVYNSRQYILPDSRIFDYAGPFGLNTAIANVNRQLRADGIPPPRMPYGHTLELGGALAPQTPTAETGYGRPMVSHRIRHLNPVWPYAEFISPYHTVHNAAFRAQPVGFDSRVVPTQHRVWFNAQEIRPPHLVRPDSFGRPFVAFRVRTLQQYLPASGYGEGYPMVGHSPRYVVVKPWELFQLIGVPVVFHPPTRFIQAGITRWFDDFGLARVRNLTPQIYPPPIIFDDIGPGRPWVSRSPRKLAPTSIQTAAYGTPDVSLANRTIFPLSVSGSRVPMPKVWQEVDEVVHDVTLFAAGADSAGYGTPTVRNYPHPLGIDSLRMGAGTRVQLMGCHPYWSWPDSVFGIPSLNATQTITQINRNDERGSQTGWSFQRVDPYTIWARTDPPQQARENHPGFPYHVIDSRLDDPDRIGVPPWFGHHRVYTPGPQTLRPYHPTAGADISEAAGERFGVTRIEHSIRHVYPLGIRAGRYGFPSLNGPNTIWVQPIAPADDQVGTPSVGTPPNSTQWIGAAGLYAYLSGLTIVENWIREVFPEGFLATVFGNNDPMVYLYPRGPKQAGGFDSSEFSDETWVSYKDREIFPEGFDAFEEGYTFGEFTERMRVRVRGGGAPGVGDSLRMGFPVVSTAREAQHIRPYMIPPPQYCHPHAVTEG